ncbi:GNAT family N-acetyltransferase [Solimonas sp. K1W22B-7]|uniref:cyclic nucleotide-binding domain-containing protein n=1 Tax=Solimonas sp. K1W22B-7 TaxID=2303331 RepID=UPI000E337DCE|nr:cyclic nucleotide-binding domain-containing protein [Solimonas sp. K1W22B-7]AXQ31471.1 GNAT family N-acetyltransferase [Solimonas sp. K1W22B-7]
MKVDIKQAQTPEEFAACARQRYRVYTEEMNLYHDAADQQGQQLSDPDDAWSRFYYAAVDGEVVASLRFHWGSDGQFSEEWNAVYRFDSFAPDVLPEQMAVGSRLTVDKAYRGSALPGQLVAHGLTECLRDGKQLVFLDCVPHLINYYTRLGWRQYTDNVEDTNVGILVPMCLVFDDRDHLARVGSNLLALVDAVRPGVTAGPWVHRLFPHSSYAEAALRHGSQSAVFQLLSEGLLPIFQGFTTAQVQLLTDQSNILDCEAGALFIRRRTVYRSVFVVLSGQMEVLGDKDVVATIGKGELVGEMSFVLGGMRSADVRAGPEGAQVLSLQENILRKMLDADTALASRFYHNLSRILALRLAGVGARGTEADA